MPFTYDEGKSLVLECAELTDEQLEAAAGGWSFCIGPGFGEVGKGDTEASCNSDGGYGWGACLSVGQGLFAWNS